MASYMEIDTLNRLTGEGAVVSAASHVCRADCAAGSGRSDSRTCRRSSPLAMKAYTLSSFLDKIAGLVFVSAGVLTAFAVIITVGVVYNSARIGLQERAWELASLRVLGFTRAEVAGILFGEFAIEIALGVPIGLMLSHGIIELIARFHSNESFQIPAVIEPRTYLIAAAVVVAAAAASAYVVRTPRRPARSGRSAQDEGVSMRITVGRIAIVLGSGGGRGGVVWALMPGPIPVEMAAVTKGRFVASVDEDGKTRIRERYVVAAPLAGRLGRMRFKVGDPIRVDDAVATIMPSPAPLLDPRSRREAEERLGAAEAALERAKAGVERARGAKRSGQD